MHQDEVNSVLPPSHIYSYKPIRRHYAFGSTQKVFSQQPSRIPHAEDWHRQAKHHKQTPHNTTPMRSSVGTLRPAQNIYLATINPACCSLSLPENELFVIRRSVALQNGSSRLRTKLQEMQINPQRAHTWGEVQKVRCRASNLPSVTAWLQHMETAD
jgi:hypothetical protein